MIEKFNIAGYCRISVDEELDRDNPSIENQKSIIKDFVKHRFPDSSLTFYEDRDRSGYTFEQRESYQTMRLELIEHKKDMLIVKDFSRFSRRNSRGLVELEDLRDAGVRIISIGDNIDFPNDDDWLKIQFQFLLNEMPVTDTSKKVKSVIKRKQKDGRWICAAPYGYIINKRQEFEIVPAEADVVRRIFSLYIDGWGYKRIANLLTDEGIPTPRMSERDRKEIAGEECRRRIRPEWAIATIHGILTNDFYIGTLRQGKYTRQKINGKDVKLDETEHIVLENHHQPIIDYRTFNNVQALQRNRSKNNYRGIKKYDNVYSGFLECGDCGSPLFSMSRPAPNAAYTCGTYHRRGTKGCTSHYIRVDKLDELLKLYIFRVRNNSSAMLDRLNADLQKQSNNISETELTTTNLEKILTNLQEELKATKRQRIRDIMKHPDREDLLDKTYDEMESELERRIEGLQRQIDMAVNKRDMIAKANSAAKTALDIFDNILNKNALDRNDIQLIIKKIRVYEDHIEILLKSDIDSLLKCGCVPETDNTANFKEGVENVSQAPYVAEEGEICKAEIIQTSANHRDKILCSNVVSEGDPLLTTLEWLDRYISAIIAVEKQIT